jgi:hypothetical protein
MKKRLFAVFCALALLVAAAPAASALSGEATRAADTLCTLGLVNGTGGASGYALNGAATRAQAVSIIVRLSGCEAAAQKNNDQSAFTDLPSWAKDSINYACMMGWVSGYSSTAFAPDRAVSADDYCTFLLRMLGYSSSVDFTHDKAARFAMHIGLTNQDYSDGTFTRGDLFELTRDALTFRYMGRDATVIENLISCGSVSRAAANALGLLDSTLNAREIADRFTSAVFQLDTYDTQMSFDAQAPSANASGFFISADGLAVTNYHSINGALFAVATLSTGERYQVEKVLYYNANIDVAVIRVSMTSTENVRASRFASLELAGTDDIRAGDTVYTIGNPLGLGLAVSSGILSDISRTVDGYALPCIMDTADISMGSSGGALLNAYGQVIGITSGAFLYGNNMYLAVPADPVMKADLTVSGWTLPQVAAMQKAADAAASQAS